MGFASGSAGISVSPVLQSSRFGLAVLRLDVDLIREIERNAVYCGFGVVRCVGHSSDPGSGKTFGCNRSPLAVPVLPLIVIRSGSGSGSGYLHQSLHVVRAFEYLAPVKVVEVNADSVLPDREIRVPSEIGTRPDDPRVCFRGGFHSSGETQRDGFLQYGRLIGETLPRYMNSLPDRTLRTRIYSRAAHRECDRTPARAVGN